MSARTKLKYTLKVSSFKKTKGRKNQKSEEKEEKKHQIEKQNLCFIKNK